MCSMAQAISTVADIVRMHAAQRPDAVALVVSDDQPITFAELDERSSRAAQAFRDAGVKTGDRVAFIDKNGAEFFEVTFGLAKLGAVVVRGELATGRAGDAADHRRLPAEVIVVGPEFFGHVENPSTKLSRVHTIVAIGEHDRWPAFGDWIAGHPTDDPRVAVAPQDVALQLYTSGTTGLPKGVMLTNAQHVPPQRGCRREVAVHRRQRQPRRDAVVPHRRRRLGVGRAVHRLHQRRDARRRPRRRSCGRFRSTAITHALLVPAVVQFLLMTPESRTSTSPRCGPRLRRLADHRRRSRRRRWRCSAASSSRCTA